GLQVVDGRYQIGYEIGGDVLNVAGRLYRVRRPLSGSVGENLQRWIEDSEVISIEPTATAPPAATIRTGRRP
ncbi:MAG: hypothetical protein ACR2GY_03590, partial [Phycisphaerales bacterium]